MIFLWKALTISKGLALGEFLVAEKKETDGPEA
jgi:hypothetical protein